MSLYFRTNGGHFWKFLFTTIFTARLKRLALAQNAVCDSSSTNLKQMSIAFQEPVTFKQEAVRSSNEESTQLG